MIPQKTSEALGTANSLIADLRTTKTLFLTYVKCLGRGLCKMALSQLQDGTSGGVRERCDAHF